MAESNREIGGYPVAAINIPTDRLTHYGLRQVTASRSRHCTMPVGYSDTALPAARVYCNWAASRFYIYHQGYTKNPCPLEQCLDSVSLFNHVQASALASPTAGLRSGLPFGSGSPGALSSGMGPLGSAPSEAYASPTRVQSHSGIYGNVAHQVDHMATQFAASDTARGVWWCEGLLGSGWLALEAARPLISKPTCAHHQGSACIQ